MDTNYYSSYLKAYLTDAGDVRKMMKTSSAPGRNEIV